MSEFFVLCTEMSDTKFVTTKHGNAAVRLRGRNRKTTFRENGREKDDVHSNRRASDCGPHNPNPQPEGVWTNSGGHPLNTPL